MEIQQAMFDTDSVTETRTAMFGTPEISALAKIEAALMSGARRYFEDHGFIEIMVPHLTKATGACENINTMFEVNFFNMKKIYLAQTGQLYLEVLTPSLKKVWCISPSFRAEPDVDNRHLIEFPLIEIEFAGGFDELLEHIQNIIHNMIRHMLSRCHEEMEILNIDRKRISGYMKPFKRITYTEAIELLQKTIEPGIKWGDDLKSRHEKFIVEHCGGMPIFITHYPKEIKFFNMKEDETNPDVVKSSDLIMPFSGEAVGAAEREYEYENIYRRLRESKMLKMLIEKGGSINDFKWFLDFYKTKKSVPHAGCGIGFNRITQAILGIDDIRAATVWPLNRETIY